MISPDISQNIMTIYDENDFNYLLKSDILLLYKNGFFVHTVVY